MNPKLELLQPYPFERLAKLKSERQVNSELEHIALSIGEPKHAAPSFVLDALANNLQHISSYPVTRGTIELKQAISDWATTRFHLKQLEANAHILPVNGTREAIFAFTQVMCAGNGGAVVMPNPFYQIYEGAAFLAGAEPIFLNCLEADGFVPDFAAVDPKIWQRCELVFVCSPGNPTGAVINQEQFKTLIELADKYDFVIASDECYSELYFDEDAPPTGLLEVCASIGRDDYKRCVVFHSLSKRSNLPGLRSGFIAGDAELMKKFLLYRTYHGSAMPVPTQIASIAAWQDETHVKENRALYREKFSNFLSILDGCLEVQRPDAGFYLWPKTPINCEDFALDLFEQKNITCLPGTFISRDAEGINPGDNRVRMALVASIEECSEAAHRVKDFVDSLS